MTRDPTRTAPRCFRPRWPRLGRTASQITLPLAENAFRHLHIHRLSSRFAQQRLTALKAALASGKSAYLAGISIGGFHNTGVGLVEITPEWRARIILNNEEERFAGRKHTNGFPRASLHAMKETVHRLRIDPRDILVWLTTYDYPLLAAAGSRAIAEELPQSLHMLVGDHSPSFSRKEFLSGLRTPRSLKELFEFSENVPLLSSPHHDNHAWLSYLVSPFAAHDEPVMVVVVDGSGDDAAISLYLGRDGALRPFWSNASLFDSLGLFYGVISSTQGGWTFLSSEGRYMGAAAYGDGNRSSNRFYLPLRNIFSLQSGGRVQLNRCLANWPRYMLHRPYTRRLIEILGPPVEAKDMWNPDAVLRVENIRHQPNTQERLDKAAATQMVFEDGLTHIIDFFVRSTRSSRLVLTGGAALNAVANMRLLEHFDENYYDRLGQRRTHLRLWVPPMCGDAGVTLGAPFVFAAAAGLRTAPALQHAFYCGSAPTKADIVSALNAASDINWVRFGDGRLRDDQHLVAEFMAFITAQDGILALFQGAAETGPRALGHRSILANPCNPHTRELLNERVKFREAIRPLAPMATLSAARQFFDLHQGASDADFNAYNYMVITVRAKACARSKIPAVIHHDGTARLQLVRQDTDPLAYAYLQALGRRIGVEVAVNTSFNVAAPIAQTAAQALATLRRARNMDALFMFSEEGPIYLAWTEARSVGQSRVREWLTDWHLQPSPAL